ncbi:MAG: Lpp/OprI family alanine-zipper lipoprotein [Gammaproteobacteria bacterium]
MKIQKAIKLCAAILATVVMTGCAGMQNDIDALKTRVDLLEQEVAAANAAAANSAAAMRAAENARATADEALAVASEGVACCDATNEKIDRMFQRSQSK